MALNTHSPVTCRGCNCFGVIVTKVWRACPLCRTEHRRVSGRIEWRKEQ